MHLSKLIAIISAIIGMAATFLPWKEETLLNETITTAGKDTTILLSAMQVGDGWLTVGLFLLILLVLITGNRRRHLKGAKAVFLLLFSATIVATCIYDIIAVTHQPAQPALAELAVTSTVGYGLYLALITGLDIFVVTLLSHRLKKPGSNRQ